MASPADADDVIGGALATCRLVCCALVIASFALFAHGQIEGASAHQVAELASGAPTSPGATPAHRVGQPRRFIDGAASVLTAPFRSLIQSGSQWVRQGIATLCALLVYGLGLGYLGRYTHGLP